LVGVGRQCGGKQPFSASRPSEKRFGEFAALIQYPHPFVDEHLIHLKLFQLTLRALTESADPDITDRLTFHLSQLGKHEPKPRACRLGSFLCFPKQA
jgi:hypothetical protein